MKRILWGIAVLMLAGSAQAVPILPGAADWDVTQTVLVNRNGGGATTSVTDLSPDDGVELSYSKATGGFLVGTSRIQYDFETDAGDGGQLTFDMDVALDAFNGFFQNEFALYTTLNGTIDQTLVAFSGNAPVSFFQTFSVALNLSASDTWGIRVIAGNFDQGSGVSGSIELKAASVPAPSALAVLAMGLVLLRLGTRKA